MGDTSLPVFAKPEPERVFASLKVFDREGSPLRVPREDWESAKRRAREIPWAEWLAEQRAAVDDWMGRRRDKVEWVAGWWHDFVSPKDGSFLTWTPEEPGPATLASPSDPSVPSTPKLHGAWVFGFRSRHGDKMVEAARLYRLTGEPRYAAWVAAQLDFYAENLTRWPEQTHRSRARLMSQSLDDATLVIRFVEAARLIDQVVDPQRKARWIRQLFLPEVDILESSFQYVHNIACWMRAAMGSIAIYAGSDDLWRRALDGPAGLRAQVARGITSDYFWFEQSLQYNAYVVSAWRVFLEHAAMAGRLAEVRAEAAAVENLMLSPIAIRFPDGRLPWPADATGWPRQVPDRALLARMNRLVPTTIGTTAAAAERTWEALIDPPVNPHAPADASRAMALPPVASRSFESSRIAVLRRGCWQVFFHYGQLHPSHAQAEALNFEATCDGTDVTHDVGTVGYGSPLHGELFTTALAHNVPIVDGGGQQGWDPGRLDGWDAQNGRVAASQSRYRENAEASRELRIDDSHGLHDTVRLVTNDGVPHVLGLVVQLQGSVRLPDAGVADVPAEAFARAHGARGFRHWRRVRRVEGTAGLVAYRDRTMQLRIEGPAAFTLYLAEGPDAPPGRREAVLIETTGTAAEFRVVFQ